MSRAVLTVGVAAAIACGHSSPTSPGTPLRSIQRLLNRASGGQTIVVPPGVYRESVTVDRSDLSNITLRGYGVTIDGSELPIPREDIDIFSPTGIGIYVRAGGGSPPQNVTIEGFVVENFDLGIWSWSGQVRNVEVRNNARGFRSTGIWAATVVDSVIHHNGGYGIRTFGGGTIRGNRIFSNGVGASEGGGVLAGGSEIIDNEVTNNSWGILLFRSSGNTVRGNRLHGNGRAGIAHLGFGSQNLIEDNDATGNGLLNVPPSLDFDLYSEVAVGPGAGNIWRNNRGKANFPQ